MTLSCFPNDYLPMLQATDKAIYLLSDLHLGAPDPARSLIREKHAVRWLESIADETKELYLLGDVFDFWFEYRHAVPRGYVRFLGQLARMSDAGIPIHVFSGNHDLWYRDYLQEQIGAEIHYGPVMREFFGARYYLAHGDGLGPGDHGYKLMKRIITHPLARWLFGRFHPNFGIGLAYWLSQNGGNHDYHNEQPDYQFICTEEDSLMIHARETMQAQPTIDYFVYGHRHKFVDQPLDETRRIFILGDWIRFFSFLKITQGGPELANFSFSSAEPLPRP
jgi:UDP-2,3-diacylglucosamine hydrolase